MKGQAHAAAIGRRARWLAIVVAAAAVSCAADDRGGADSAIDGRTLDLRDQPIAPDRGVARLDLGLDASADAGLANGLRLTLTDGRTVLGELIAIYDHQRWWQAPRAELTLAIFDPTELRLFPNDRSITFVSSLHVRAMAPAVLPWQAPRYRDALRSKAVIFDRVPLDGVAHVITGNERYHLEENGYGDFAWDLVRKDSSGARYAGDGTQNSDYFIWDANVYLPTGGVVVEVLRDVADNTPGSYKKGAPNNMVGVQVYGSYYIYLLHFRRGTIPASIVVDTYLAPGSYLGRVGNAGVSLEPHLHVTVLWYDPRIRRSYSVPSEFANIYVSATASGGALMKYNRPRSGQWIASSPF